MSKKVECGYWDIEIDFAANEEARIERIKDIKKEIKELEKELKQLLEE